MSGVWFSRRNGYRYRAVAPFEAAFLLSATDAEEIPQFTGLNKTIKLNFLNTEEQTVQRLHLYKVLSPGKDKLETLYKLLCTLGSRSTLVFCNHRESVERVGKYLQSKNSNVVFFMAVWSRMTVNVHCINSVTVVAMS